MFIISGPAEGLTSWLRMWLWKVGYQHFLNKQILYMGQIVDRTLASSRKVGNYISSQIFNSEWFLFVSVGSVLSFCLTASSWQNYVSTISESNQNILTELQSRDSLSRMKKNNKIDKAPISLCLTFCLERFFSFCEVGFYVCIMGFTFGRNQSEQTQMEDHKGLKKI